MFREILLQTNIYTKMKTKVFIVSAILLLVIMTTKAQDQTSKSYVWQWQGKTKTHTLGYYGGIYGTYSPVDNRSAQWLSGRLGVVIDKHWGLGIAGSALNYDYHLYKVVNDGTYRLQAGFAGMFIEYLIPIKEWGKVSFSWTTGKGTAFYQYDKDYRENRPWYQEIIDTEDFAVNELGMEVQFRTFRKWWIGAYGSYRLTSPIELMGQDDFFLRNYSVGVSIKYGIF